MLYENYKHSASAGNLWYENQSAFIWRYGFKNWGKDSPRANMGKAAEQAVYAALAGSIAPDAVEQCAVAIFDKMHQGEVHEEREAAGKIAKNMLGKLSELGGTFERKPREARRVPGLSKLVNFECDLFHSERGIIDLKATLRMAWGEGKDPTPHWGHIRQQGLYSRLEGGKQVSLLYATPKRCELVTVSPEDCEKGANELLDAFAQIERWADLFPEPEQAVKLIPLNLDNFYWDDPEAADAAREKWSKINLRKVA